jgi:uncharacterized protein YoxC
MNLDNLQVVINHVSISIIAVLFGGICYFFKRLIKQLDNVSISVESFDHKFIKLEGDVKNIMHMSQSVEVLRRQFDHFKKELATALVAARNIKMLEKSVHIVENSQENILRKINESFDSICILQEKIKELKCVQKDTHKC